MLKRVLLVVSLGVVLAMALASVGCASGNAFTDVLAKVPEDATSLKYLDVKALRSDEDLSGLYDDWKDDVEPRFDAHGIDQADVTSFATGVSPNKRFTIVAGQFELDGVREELEDRHYEDDVYKGVEVWTRQLMWGPELDRVVALMDDLIIFGNEAGVEGCLKVIKADDASWLSRSDIKDVSGRLPAGLYVDMSETVPLLQGMNVYGRSATKMDGDTFKISGAAKFDDASDAEAAEDKLEEWMELEFKSVDVNQDGAFLKASAKLKIDDAHLVFQVN